MGIYLSILPVLIIGKLISVRCHEKYRNSAHIDLFLTFIPFFMMAIIVGLRSADVGVDTINYINLADDYVNYTYRNIFDLSIGQHSLLVGKTELEIGFVCITKFLYETFHSSQAILIFMAAVTYFTFWISVNLLSDDPYLSALMVLSAGYFTNTLNIARQMTVIGILFAIYYFLLKKNWLASVILLIFACSLHQTVILVFLIMLFLRLIPVRRQYAMIMFGCMFLVVALVHPLAVLFVTYFPKYIGFLAEKELLLSIGMIRLLWAVELAFTFYLLLYGFSAIENKALTLYERHMFCCICFTYLYIGLYLCGQYVWLVNRFALYFQLGTIFLFPMVQKRLRQFAPKPLYFLFTYGIWLFFIFWYVRSIQNDPTQIANYVSQWLTL